MCFTKQISLFINLNNIYLLCRPWGGSYTVWVLRLALVCLIVPSLCWFCEVFWVHKEHPSQHSGVWWDGDYTSYWFPESNLETSLVQLLKSGEPFVLRTPQQTWAHLWSLQLQQQPGFSLPSCLGWKLGIKIKKGFSIAWYHYPILSSGLIVCAGETHPIMVILWWGPELPGLKDELPGFEQWAASTTWKPNLSHQ